MRTRLNLATSPLEGDRRFVVTSATAGIVGFLLMVVLAWHSYSVWRTNTILRGQQQSLVADMERLQSERRALESFFNSPDSVRRRDLASFLNGLIAQRAFPWTRIFMDLEHSLPSGARIISVEPTLVGDHLQLRFTVEALNDEAKLQFLRSLESSVEFSQIQLLSERRPDRSGESNPIVMSLTAQYSVS